MPYGDKESYSFFKLRSGNTTPFKQMGSSKFGSDVINKEVTRIAKGGKAKVDILANKTAKKVAKKTLTKTILKGTSKIASKLLGPIGWGLTAVEVVETIPKVSKATIKGLKKRAKSGNVNIGRKL